MKLAKKYLFKQKEMIILTLKNWLGSESWKFFYFQNGEQSL